MKSGPKDIAPERWKVPVNDKDLVSLIINNEMMRKKPKIADDSIDIIDDDFSTMKDVQLGNNIRIGEMIEDMNQALSI